jgi:magnesium transporter
MDEQPDMVYYFYVVERGDAPPPDDPDGDIPEYLQGVVTLRQLVSAPPTASLAELMQTDVITAQATDRADDAARLLIEYGLYALPVVGEDREILGIIMVDDAMERLLPDSWRQRLKVFS